MLIHREGITATFCIALFGGSVTFAQSVEGDQKDPLPRLAVEEIYDFDIRSQRIFSNYTYYISLSNLESYRRVRCYLYENENSAAQDWLSWTEVYEGSGTSAKTHLKTELAEVAIRCFYRG